MADVFNAGFIGLGNMAWPMTAIPVQRDDMVAILAWDKDSE